MVHARPLPAPGIDVPESPAIPTPGGITRSPDILDGSALATCAAGRGSFSTGVRRDELPPATNPTQAVASSRQVARGQHRRPTGPGRRPPRNTDAAVRTRGSRRRWSVLAAPRVRPSPRTAPPDRPCCSPSFTSPHPLSRCSGARKPIRSRRALLPYIGEKSVPATALLRSFRGGGSHQTGARGAFCTGGRT